MIRALLLTALILICPSAYCIQSVTGQLATVYHINSRVDGSDKSSTDPGAAFSSAYPAFTVTNFNGIPNCVESHAFVFQSYRNASDITGSVSYIQQVTYGGLCSNSFSDYSSVGTVGVTFRVEATCPQYSTNVGSADSPVCACGSNYMPSTDGKSCYQYTCGVAGSYSAVTQPDQKVSNAGDTICDGGCGYTPSSWKVGTDGQIWATWPFKATGHFCDGKPDASNPGVSTGDANNKNPAPVACGVNMCPGTVNGASVCVACFSQNVQGSTSSASAAGGSSSIDGVPGATSKQDSTSCNGTTCTTTTTYSDSSGAVVGSKTDTKDQSSFCKDNPSLQICKDSTIAASCASFTCNGDAVQCAIAQEAYKSKCDWDKVDSSLVGAGNSAIGGGDQPAGHPGLNPSVITLGSGTLDMTERLGGGCPSDYSFSVNGRSYVIPFSQQCSNLNLIGQCMVAVCLLAAVMIVFRGNN